MMDVNLSDWMKKDGFDLFKGWKLCTMSPVSLSVFPERSDRNTI